MSTLPARVVLRAQLAIRTLPIVGDFDAPREAADAIAVDGDDGPVRRAGGMNRLRVPREDALHPIRQTALALRDEFADR